MEEVDRRGQILDAAFEEFSEKGFKGATIKSIARAAGLQSPALIYWYFPDKEALFREVLGSKIPVLRAVREPSGLLDPRHRSTTRPASSRATATCTRLCASTPLDSICTSQPELAGSLADGPLSGHGVHLPTSSYQVRPTSPLPASRWRPGRNPPRRRSSASPAAGRARG